MAISYGQGQPLPYGFAFAAGASPSSLNWGSGPNGSPFRVGTQENDEYQGLYARRGAEIAPGVGQNDAQNKIQGVIDAQTASENEFLGRYKSAIPTITSAAESKYGVPEALQRAQVAQNTLSAIPWDTQKASQGYASNSQVDMGIAQRIKNISPQTTALINNAQSAQQLAAADVNANLAPYTAEASMVSDRLAQSISGYNNAIKSDLDMYTSILNNNRELSIAQMQDATRKLEMEQGYKNILAQGQNQQALQNSQNAAGNTQVVEANGRKLLIDSTTGRTIQDLGSSTAPSTGTGGVGNYLAPYLTPPKTGATSSFRAY